MQSKKQNNSADVDRVAQIIDEIDSVIGINCPSWMLLDAIASSCRENNFVVEESILSDAGNPAPTHNKCLVIDNRLILECKTDTKLSGNKGRLSNHSGKGRKLLSRQIRNSLINLVVLPNQRSVRAGIFQDTMQG
jgi:hypothetical protein